PFLYRKAAMKRLNPAQRASVWQSHLQAYIDQHPDLSESARGVLYNAVQLASASTFANPTDDTRAQAGVLAEQTKALLGASEADYLFYRLGPKDSGFASAIPLKDSLANFVRG